MPKLIDLTGQNFGRLTVLEKDKNKKNKVYWICQCQCGSIKSVQGYHLRTGHTQSCGCLQKEKAGQQNFIDISNKKYGTLTVIKYAGSNEKGNALWKCKCDCGNIINVLGIELRRGHTTSCGCVKSKGERKIAQILTENNIPFETQKTFDTCRFPDTNALAKFDFWVNNEYLIESDGIQHFKLDGWGEKLEQIKYRDEYKNKWCKDNKILLIRIPYTKYEQIDIQDLILKA